MPIKTIAGLIGIMQKLGCRFCKREACTRLVIQTWWVGGREMDGRRREGGKEGRRERE